MLAKAVKTHKSQQSTWSLDLTLPFAIDRSPPASNQAANPLAIGLSITGAFIITENDLIGLSLFFAVLVLDGWPSKCSGD